MQMFAAAQPRLFILREETSSKPRSVMSISQTDKAKQFRSL
jgi:hypothetical protein